MVALLRIQNNKALVWAGSVLWWHSVLFAHVHVCGSITAHRLDGFPVLACFGGREGWCGAVCFLVRLRQCSNDRRRVREETAHFWMIGGHQQFFFLEPHACLDQLCILKHLPVKNTKICVSYLHLWSEWHSIISGFQNNLTPFFFLEFWPIFFRFTLNQSKNSRLSRLDIPL